MDDIVEKLRHMAWLAPEGEPYADDLAEAADEIQRLQHELADWQRTVRYLVAEIASLSETKPRRLRKPLGTVYPPLQ